MSTDEPGRDDAETTAPYTRNTPPKPQGDFDGELTTPLGYHQQPPPAHSPETRIAPQPESLGHAGPTSAPQTQIGPITGPGPTAGRGWQPQPGYPPQQGYPQGHSPQPGYSPQQGYSGPPPIYAQPAPSDNRKWYLIGGAVVAVIVVVAAAVLLLGGGNDDTTATSTTTSTSALATATPSRTTTSATPTVANVDPTNLPQLLLSPDVVSTTMGSPGMVPGPVQRSTDITTNDSVINPLECSSAWGPGKPWQYVNSAFLGLARQIVSEQPSNQHVLVQAVIAFPDDIAARKSYNTQVKSWAGCQGKTVTSHLNASTPDQTADIGSLSDNGDIATLQVMPHLEVKEIACQRVLSPVGNVLIDVRSCSPDVGDTGVTVTHDIAAKITGG